VDAFRSILTPPAKSNPLFVSCLFNGTVLGDGLAATQARGSMPAQLFAIRQPTGAAPALPDATMQELQPAMKDMKG